MPDVIALTFPTVISLVALSLQTASAAVMFLIARAPGWSRVRLLGYIALTAACYCAVNLFASVQPTGTPLLGYVFEANLLFGALHGCMWIWFTFSRSDGQWSSVPRWARWHAVGTLVFTALVSFTGSATDRANVGFVRAGLRGVSTDAYALTALGDVTAVLVFVIFGTCFYEYRRRAGPDKAGAGGVYLGFGLFCGFVAFEMLVAAGVVEFYFLAELGHLAIIVPLVGQLLNRFERSARRWAELSESLASEVEERTSERDRARESLVEQERLASLGRLASGVGHEINNPLQYLLSNLEELELAVRDDPRPGVNAAVSASMEGVDRIRRVVTSLRRYGAEAASFEPVNLHEVVRAALRIAGPQLRSMASVRAEFGDVPSVMGDEGQLVQMVVNPLVNSAQAIADQRQSGAEIVIALSTLESGDAVIEVRDNGPGFPDELLPRLGEPYLTTRSQTGGSGLGIFLTLSLVTAHGGRMSLSNAPSGGAVVRLELPTAGGVATAVTAETALPASVTSGAHRVIRAGPGRRILVVDDEPALLHAMRRSLTRLGHQVRVARDGAEALAIVEHDTFDVVLSDLMMPGMSGVALAEALARDHPVMRSRFVVMTGGAMSTEEAEFLSREDVRVLNKPVRLAELEATVDALTAAVGSAI